MNAESEMQTSDGLGAAPDPLDELRRECGYSPDAEDDGGDALIAYKDALEDVVGRMEANLDRTEAALTQIQHVTHDGLGK